MQNLNTLQTTGLSLELFHVQTNTSFAIPSNFNQIRIGKPNETSNPDIDVSGLPHDDIVSRLHTAIQIQGHTYYIEDLASSNGTYLNKTRLEPKIPYPLKIGDKIDLGQGEKVTFIFQYQQPIQTTNASISNHTMIQPQKQKVDRTSKLLGTSLIIAGIVVFAASTQVGIIVRLPGILLCIVGAGLLVSGRLNPLFGLLLILGGIAVIAVTGGIFASVNLLSVVIAFALIAAGYQLFTSGKIWKYDWRSLKESLKQKRD